MDLALRDFKRTLADNDVALFFFAGHGMQIEGENYLAAIDLARTPSLSCHVQPGPRRPALSFNNPPFVKKVSHRSSQYLNATIQ